MELNDRYKNQILQVIDFDKMGVQYDNDSSKLLSVAMHIPRKNEILEDESIEIKPNYVKLLSEIDIVRQILKSHNVKIYDDINFRDSELHGPCFDLINIQNYAFLDSQLLIQSPENKLNSEMIYLLMMKNGYNDRFAKLTENIKMSGNDIIRVSEKHYIVGVGNKTDEEFVELLGKIHPTVKIHTVNLREGYLNDYMFSPNSNTIIYRSSIITPIITDIKFVRVNDTIDLKESKAFNVIVLGKNRLLMSNSSRKLIDMFKGYATVETVEINELSKLNVGLNQIILPILKTNGTI